MVLIGCVADRAGHPGGTTAAGVITIPWLVRVILADPERVLTFGAMDRHWSLSSVCAFPNAGLSVRDRRRVRQG